MKIVSFICEKCKIATKENLPHDDCRGGTWCDCGHRTEANRQK